MEAVVKNPIDIAADAPTTSGLAALRANACMWRTFSPTPDFRNYADHAKGNYRAGLAVPLKRDGEVLGVIALSRPEARGYDEHRSRWSRALPNRR